MEKLNLTLLVIEDETRMAEVIGKGLEEEGYRVILCPDGETGLADPGLAEVALFILDVMLPGMDGFTVCRRLRERGVSAPIIMLTARSQLNDKVFGLDSGANDYLTKPFAFEELLARVRVLLRGRSSAAGGQELLKIQDLSLDQQSQRVYRSGREIELSRREFALLEYLMRNTGKLVTRTMIAENVWNQECNAYSNVIDVFINHLRKKVDEDFPIKLIQTQRGRGFMLEAQEEKV